MNEDKELEEAIKELQERMEMLNRHIKNYEESNCKTNVYLQLIKEKNAIETVLKALENKQTLIYKLESGEDFTSKQVKFLEKNFISKKKIEDLLEEVYTDEGIGYELDKDEKPGAIRVLKKLLKEG